MKASLLAGFAVSALLVPAMAADIIFPPHPDMAFPPHADMAFPPPSLIWTWTGLYLGANVGWSDSSRSANAIKNTGTDVFATEMTLGRIPRTLNLNETGLFGGGEVGYNWQLGRTWVLGIEGDFDAVGGDSNNITSALSTGKGLAPLLTTYNRRLDSLGTFRGRLGYLIAPDQLWYMTGGLAFGHTIFGSSYICGNCTPSTINEGSTASTTSNASTGWTIGGGVEWKFIPSWSIKAEYLYVDLGSPSNTITYTSAGKASTLTSAVDERENVFRVGISYKLF